MQTRLGDRTVRTPPRAERTLPLAEQPATEPAQEQSQHADDNVDNNVQNHVDMLSCCLDLEDDVDD
ncbi:MAG: hypothetical protein WC052_04380 [Patescibacteria group bacterium]